MPLEVQQTYMNLMFGGYQVKFKSAKPEVLDLQPHAAPLQRASPHLPQADAHLTTPVEDFHHQQPQYDFIHGYPPGHPNAPAPNTPTHMPPSMGQHSRHPGIATLLDAAAYVVAQGGTEGEEGTSMQDLPARKRKSRARGGGATTIGTKPRKKQGKIKHETQIHCAPEFRSATHALAVPHFNPDLVADGWQGDFQNGDATTGASRFDESSMMGAKHEGNNNHEDDQSPNTYRFTFQTPASSGVRVNHQSGLPLNLQQTDSPREQVEHLQPSMMIPGPFVPYQSEVNGYANAWTSHPQQGYMPAGDHQFHGHGQTMPMPAHDASAEEINDEAHNTQDPQAQQIPHNMHEKGGFFTFQGNPYPTQ